MTQPGTESNVNTGGALLIGTTELARIPGAVPPHGPSAGLLRKLPRPVRIGGALVAAARVERSG